jgi:hypothetical protein
VRLQATAGFPAELTFMFMLPAADIRVRLSHSNLFVPAKRRVFFS